MAYLTFSEYKELGFSETDETTFLKLTPYVEGLLDSVTGDFYRRHELAQDMNDYRATAFRRALAIEYDYLKRANVSTLQEALKQSPTSVSIGRLHLEISSSQAGTVGASLFSIEAYRALAFTGLLFRGVDVQ